MKKILFVIPGIDNSNSMPFVRVLQENINTLNVKCDAHFSNSSYNILKFFRNIKEISKKLREGSYDICVSQFGGYSGISSVIAGKIANVPVVVTFRGSDLNPPFFGLPIDQYIKQLFSNFCSHIVNFFANGCVFVSARLRNRTLFPTKNAVIASGADFNFFIEKNQFESRKQLGFSKDARIALFFSGSSRFMKNTQLAIKLKGYIDKDFPDVDFKIIDKFVSKADLRLFFSAADCLVFLSKSEGCPTIIQEACAMNLPIVSLDVGGVKEVLQGISYHKIVPNDLEKIASAVVCITRKRKRSNGRSITKEFYCAYNNAKRSIDFYQDVIDTFRKKECL